MKSVMRKVIVAMGIASVFAASAETLYWTGANSGNWIGAPKTNWTNVENCSNWTNSLGEVFYETQGKDLYFGDITSGNTNITIEVIARNKPWVATNGTFTINSSQNYYMQNGINCYIAELSALYKYGTGTFSIFAGSNTFTNDIYVYEGTLQLSLGVNNQINPECGGLGNMNVPRKIYVGPQGKLTLPGMAFGKLGTAPKATIEIDGGTLKVDKDHIIFGKLILHNATLDYGKGHADIGFLDFNGDVYFSGTNVYSLLDVENNWIGISTHEGSPTTFYVDDITGDDDADVILGWHIRDWLENRTDPSSRLYPSSLIKAGKGTLELRAFSSYTGDLDIREGTVISPTTGSTHVNYINRMDTFLGNSRTNRTVFLRAGTSLDLRAHGTLSYPSSCFAMTINASNATIRIANETQNTLPNLDLYDATIIADKGAWNRIIGNGYVLGFSGYAKFDGTKPYVFTNGTYRAMTLGYGTNRRDWEGICDDMRCECFAGDTEMYVCDITKNGESDVIFENQLTGIPKDHANNFRRLFSCGLIKTGDGTLQFDHNNNNYTGKTEVVEGVLRLNGIIKESPVTVRDGGFIAGTGEFQKPVTIENGGGFAVDSVNPIATNLTISDLTLPEVGTLRVQNYTGALANLRMTIPQTIANATNFGDIDFSTWRVLVDGHTAKESRVMKVSLTDDNHLKISYKPDGFSVIVR